MSRKHPQTMKTDFKVFGLFMVGCVVTLVGLLLSWQPLVWLGVGIMIASGLWFGWPLF